MNSLLQPICQLSTDQLYTCSETASTVDIAGAHSAFEKENLGEEIENKSETKVFVAQ